MSRFSKFGAALALVAGMVVPVVFAAPAQAATCNSSTCTGKDPQAAGCSPDARTLTEFTDGSFRVEMRYSPLCGAAWTRVSTPSGTPGWYCNTVFAQIRGYNSADTFQLNYGTQAACPGQKWTAMISFTYYVRSCLATWFDASPYVCTGRR